MENRLKKELDNKRKVLGTFFETGSTQIVECLGISGFDFIIIDTEHGPFETESVSEFVCASNKRNVTPFVRTKDASRPSILKNLDVGAMGLIVPNIQSIEEIHQLVRYGKYYPKGERGVAFARGCGYGMEKEQSMEEYFEECNRETMLFPQCETLGCLNDIENIAAVDGVDGVFVGPYDLSTAMGKAGKFSDMEVKKAIARILEACKKNGKYSMIYADDSETAKSYLEQGFDSVAICMDTILMIRAMRSLLSETRE